MFDPAFLKIEGEALHVIHDLTQKVLKATIDIATEQLMVAKQKGINPQVFSAYLCSSGVRLACMWAQQQIMMGMEDYRELPMLSREEQDQLIQDVYFELNNKLVALFNDRISRQS